MLMLFPGNLDSKNLKKIYLSISKKLGGIMEGNEDTIMEEHENCIDQTNEIHEDGKPIEEWIDQTNESQGAGKGIEEKEGTS